MQIITSVNYVLILLLIVYLILYIYVNLVCGDNLSFKYRHKLTPLCISIYRSFPSYKSHFYKHHRELISKFLHNKNKNTFCLSNDKSNNSLVSHILILINMHWSTKKLKVITMRISYHRISVIK